MTPRKSAELDLCGPLKVVGSVADWEIHNFTWEYFTFSAQSQDNANNPPNHFQMCTNMCILLLIVFCFSIIYITEYLAVI